MYKLLLLILSLGILAACDKGAEKVKESTAKNEVGQAANAIPDTTNMPKLKFQETAFDFGTINEGEVVLHVFKFTNTGKSPLIITDARGSCGCTIPTYPKDKPIAPSESGEIEVRFNSKNKKGTNQKHVSIVANTYPEVTTISITANVNAVETPAGGLPVAP